MKRIIRLSVVSGLLALFAPTASAQPVADFYRGKTISIYVGFPPAGGYDIYARIMAPFFSRHIPGNPTITIMNMVGGSGVRAAAYISNVTAQDGTSLGLFLDTTTIGKVLGGPGDFDPVKLQWIGRIASTDSVAMVWHTAPAQTVEEAKRIEIAMAVTQPGTSTSMIAAALNDLVGTKFKLVRGYQGSPGMALAMERGEVHAMGGMSWDAVKTTKQDWLKENKARVLYTFGMRRLTDLPDAPALVELAIDDQSRTILSLIGGGAEVGRSLVVEPGTPPERTAVLRKAFMETMNDPAFLADMKKRNLLVEPLSGDDVQKLVANAVATPPALVNRAKRYVGKRQQMIIDWHTHVHSLREQAMPFWKGQCPATIDNVLRLHDEVGLDLSVISNSGHYLKEFPREEAVPHIRASNEYLASLRNKHKDKIVAIAVAIPGGGDDHLRELERAVREDDLRGVLISSSHRRAYPDDDDARPFFQLCCDLDIPVFMHPPSVGFGEERMQEFRLASSIGRPFDSCLALARLIVKGLWERFPKIKFVASHLGGGISEVIGRMDYAYELRDNPLILGPYGPPVHITRKPSEYLRMMYFDTVAYHAPAIKCAIETVGADRLIFGTDSPMLVALKRRGLAVIDELGLDARAKDVVLSGNAKKLLKL